MAQKALLGPLDNPECEAKWALKDPRERKVLREIKEREARKVTEVSLDSMVCLETRELLVSQVPPALLDPLDQEALLEFQARLGKRGILDTLGHKGLQEVGELVGTPELRDHKESQALQDPQALPVHHQPEVTISLLLQLIMRMWAFRRVRSLSRGSSQRIHLKLQSSMKMRPDLTRGPTQQFTPRSSPCEVTCWTSAVQMAAK